MNRRNSFNVHNEELEKGRSFGLLLIIVLTLTVSVSIMLPHLH